MIDLNATLFAQVINFLILVAILTAVAYKPLLRMLEERRAKIEGSITAAAKERRDAEALRLEYQKQLAEARTQAQAIVDKAVKTAGEAKDEIMAEARAEHARLLKEAQEEIARERQRAFNELRGEVVSLSMAAAAKIIASNIDEQANAKLVAEFIDQLDERKIGGLPC